MPLAHKQPFFASSEFVVRRAFIFDGEEFSPGDDFPSEELGCEPRKLRNLFEAGYLIHKPQDDEDEDESNDDEGKNDLTDEEKKAAAELRRQKKAERRAQKRKKKG